MGLLSRCNIWSFIIAILSTTLVDFNEDETTENTEFDEIELDIM
ncbi:hypothetical protein [Clostridioides difficile]